MSINISERCFHYETLLMAVGNPLTGIKISPTSDIEELQEAKCNVDATERRNMFQIVNGCNVRLAGLTFPVPLTGNIAYSWLKHEGSRSSTSGNFCRIQFLTEPLPKKDCQCRVKYFKTGKNGADEYGLLSPVFDDLVFAVSFATAESLQGFERKNLVQESFVEEVRTFETIVTANTPAQQRRQELMHPVILSLPADNKFKIFCDACSLEPDFTADQLIRYCLLII